MRILRNFLSKHSDHCIEDGKTPEMDKVASRGARAMELERDLRVSNSACKSVRPCETGIEAQLQELRMWVEALSRRLEELEATAFQLVDDEEIILVARARSNPADL